MSMFVPTGVAQLGETTEAIQGQLLEYRQGLQDLLGQLSRQREEQLDKQHTLREHQKKLQRQKARQQNDSTGAFRSRPPFIPAVPCGKTFSEEGCLGGQVLTGLDKEKLLFPDRVFEKSKLWQPGDAVLREFGQTRPLKLSQSWQQKMDRFDEEVARLEEESRMERLKHQDGRERRRRLSSAPAQPSWRAPASTLRLFNDVTLLKSSPLTGVDWERATSPERVFDMSQVWIPAHMGATSFLTTPSTARSRLRSAAPSKRPGTAHTLTGRTGKQPLVAKLTLEPLQGNHTTRSHTTMTSRQRLITSST